MRVFRQLSPLLVGSAALVALAGVILALTPNQAESSSTTLGVAVVLIAIATLAYTAPLRADLRVVAQPELELDDLIFYVHQEPTSPGPPDIPREYLLQLQLAVYNIGDRKAVLSSIWIDSFKNAKGEYVHLPEAPEKITGSIWIQQSGWLAGRQHFSNLMTPPPYILEADDVITVRFRARRGIDWSSRWTPAQVDEFCHPLDEPIVAAKGLLIWRRGGEVKKHSFEVPVTTAEQDRYVERLHDINKRPDYRPVPRPIDFE